MDQANKPGDARDAIAAASMPLRRLFVMWRKSLSNTYEAVGRLECRAEGYEFSYLPRAATIQGFRPFLGFSDIRRQYWSTRLFPLFAERVMDPARPDRQRWLESLGLDGDPDVMEVLARSGGGASATRSSCSLSQRSRQRGAPAAPSSPTVSATSPGL